MSLTARARSSFLSAKWYGVTVRNLRGQASPLQCVDARSAPDPAAGGGGTSDRRLRRRLEEHLHKQQRIECRRKAGLRQRRLRELSRSRRRARQARSGRISTSSSRRATRWSSRSSLVGGRDAVFRRQALGLRDRRRRRVRFRLGDEQHDAGDRHLRAEQAPAGQLQDGQLDVLSPGLRQLLLPRGAEEGARAPPPGVGHRLGHRNDRHPIAHSIGAGALLRYHGNVGKAFGQGDPTCGSGYYHGLLQWKLAGVTPDKVASVARNVCSEPYVRSERVTTTTSACTVSATG